MGDRKYSNIFALLLYTEEDDVSPFATLIGSEIEQRYDVTLMLSHVSRIDIHLNAVALFKIKDSYKETLPPDFQAQFDDLSFVVFEKTNAWQSVFRNQYYSKISNMPEGPSLRRCQTYLEKAFLGPRPIDMLSGKRIPRPDYPVCRLERATAKRLKTPDDVLQFLKSETIPSAIHSLAAKYFVGQKIK